MPTRLTQNTFSDISDQTVNSANLKSPNTLYYQERSPSLSIFRPHFCDISTFYDLETESQVQIKHLPIRKPVQTDDDNESHVIQFFLPKSSQNQKLHILTRSFLKNSTKIESYFDSIPYSKAELKSIVEDLLAILLLFDSIEISITPTEDFSFFIKVSLPENKALFYEYHMQKQDSSEELENQIVIGQFHNNVLIEHWEGNYNQSLRYLSQVVGAGDENYNQSPRYLSDLIT